MNSESATARAIIDSDPQGVTLLDVDGVEINAEAPEETEEFNRARAEFKSQFLQLQPFLVANRTQRRQAKIYDLCPIGKTKLTSTKVDRNAPCECGCGLKSKRCPNKLPASNT